MSTEYDFGFSLLDEDELKKAEQELQDKLDTTVLVKESEKTSIEEAYRERIANIKTMILPLLNNLIKEPNKTHIYWPQRSKIVGEFTKKFTDLTDRPVVLATPVHKKVIK